MKPVSKLLNDKVIQELKAAIGKGKFPGITFENAMTFFLTEGIIPESGLPTQSFLDLEQWIRTKNTRQPHAFTATELKNKTGTVIDSVMQGNEVTIVRHGRPIAVIRPVPKSVE